MSKKLFFDDEILNLSNNKYVKTVREKELPILMNLKLCLLRSISMEKYQRLLKNYKLGQSMSRCGNCWDNAPQDHSLVI